MLWERVETTAASFPERVLTNGAQSSMDGKPASKVQQRPHEEKVMGAHHEAELDGLEKRAIALRDAILGLNAEQDIQELIRIWRRSGWTTPAEFLFVSGLVDVMATQVDALARVKTTLMKGSVAVAPG
jgi:hypothetical protein